MEYKDVIDYIQKISTFGSKSGLERIEQLLNYLDNPHYNLKFIHVAGTNGKGSTCAMLESILVDAGYKVGLYTSPHLIKYNERIKINNIDIDDETFTNIAEIVIDKCLNCIEHPTLFEIITAIALCYFNQQKVDYIILEVGLGGRYDATNIINSPILSIITSISLDHCEILGNTIEQISTEKGGIIKENSKTILAFNSYRVYNIINNICNEKNSRLYYLDNIKFNIMYQDLYSTTFSIETDYYNYPQIVLGMIGEYQIYNVATALLAVCILKDIGIKIKDKNIYNGLKNIHWKARMELISSKPYILFDGAHNIDSIRRLADYIRKYIKNRSITLLIAVLKNKNYVEMINILIPLVDKVVITEVTSEHTLTADEFNNIISIYDLPTYKEKQIKKAFIKAKNITNQNDIIICTGSLYLLGELECIIKEEQNA